MENNLKLRFMKILLAAAALLVSGCGGGPPNILGENERVLKTEESTYGPGWRFHELAHYPRGIGLQFPGMIIGVEKSVAFDHPKNEWIDSTRVDALDEKSQKLAEKLTGDSKAMAITHVANYRFANGFDPVPGRIANCFLFNYYDRPEKRPGCPVMIKPQRLSVLDGWNALRSVRKTVLARINQASAKRPISHLIVVTMGWNTPQSEAIRNFNSLLGNLYDRAAQTNSDLGKSFNPYFIGLTWPSYWKGLILNVLPISYFNKADDADEVGLSWLGALVGEVLHFEKHELGGKPRPRLIALGHSFGARALSRAIFTGSVLSTPSDLLHKKKIRPVVDLFVGLEAAFSINRFLDNGDSSEGAPYAHTLDRAGKVVLTSSVYDKAMDVALWADMAGNETSFNKICDSKSHARTEFKKNFHCLEANPEGEVNPAFAPGKACVGSKQPCKIAYVNADELVRFNAVGTGGGAHSDIYRPEMAALIWQAIENFAP